MIKLKPEYTTVWSFPERGNWATHRPDYRGNFAPQLPRNIIEMYSEEGDTILDPMVGGGTTLIEAKLLARNGIGIDINPKAIKLAKESLNFKHIPKSNHIIKEKDARNLDFIDNSSIDLVLTHPPYLNIIRYSNGEIKADLSNIGSLTKFSKEIRKIAEELYRVLKPGKYCAILIGDTRKGKHYVPLAFNVMLQFLKTGFLLKEDILKVQHNCKMTKRWKWKAKKNKFYLIMHEHLFVFRKPKINENTNRLKFSSKRAFEEKQKK